MLIIHSNKVWNLSTTSSLHLFVLISFNVYMQTLQSYMKSNFIMLLWFSYWDNVWEFLAVVQVKIKFYFSQLC